MFTGRLSKKIYSFNVYISIKQKLFRNGFDPFWKRSILELPDMEIYRVFKGPARSNPDNQKAVLHRMCVHNYTCRTITHNEEGPDYLNADSLRSFRHFGFKRQFQQTMMCYGTSEYCAWLSTLMFHMECLFLRSRIWNAVKVGKNPFRSCSSVPESWRNLGHLSRSFDKVKNETELYVKGDIEALCIIYNRNKYLSP